MSRPRKVIDSHIHFYDYEVNTHTFLNEFDPNYAAFVGDYSALPRIYLPEDYLQESQNYQVDGVIWHEFLSENAIQEVNWASRIARQTELSMAMVAIIDFLDPALPEKLDIYQSISKVTSIREHMVWDDHNPKKRFAKRPDLLRDPNWQKQLKILNQYDFKCGLEVFSPQLLDLMTVVEMYPNIGFTIALMGWPLDLSKDGYQQWQKDLIRLSRCDNICIDISAIECIFGMDWNLEQVKPWVLTAIDIFGAKRCMFGSHMPIAKLSCSFTDLYSAYEQMIDGCSDSEKEDLLYNVAKQWFKL